MSPAATTYIPEIPFFKYIYLKKKYKHNSNHYAACFFLQKRLKAN